MKPVLHKPKPSLLFVGRKDILDKLQKIFTHCADSKFRLRRSCLLWGTGGIGKTQICLKFIEEMSSRLSHVFWVDASSLQSIIMSLRGISSISAVQGSCLDDSVESVLQWMSGIQDEWLIVLDNMDDLPVYVVDRFIPPGNRGNVLVTSCNQSMGRVLSFENIIEINEMEEADAITLLLKASCLDASADHLQAAKNIVTSLGCMPLAVDQAGAYIEARKCDINEYLRQLSSHQQTLMLDDTFREASNYDQTVYETCDLSFKEIKKRASGQSSAGDAQAAHAAISILQICAFYHHSNISKDIFRSAAEELKEYVVNNDIAEKLPLAMPLLDCTLVASDNNGHWDELILEQGITVLLSFSLMKRDESSEMLFVHPLVHSWSREKISKIELRSMANLARTYASQGNFNKAEQLGVQVLDLRKKLFGAEHPDTLISMENLAGTYTNKGNFKEAEQLGTQILDMRKRLLGVEHPYTLLSMRNLAKTYSSQRKWIEAEQLEIQVLDMSKKLLGEEHPNTLISTGNLARTYSDKGNFNEAEQLEIQVLNLNKRLLGVEHPDTLRSMANLARTYANKGNFNEAEQLEVQVLDMRKKLFGAEHLHTLLSMGNLASTCSSQGKWNEAEQLEVQVLDLRKKLLGVEHPRTLLSMGNLASTYSSQGKWNEAEQLEVRY